MPSSSPLIPHPASPCPALGAILVRVSTAPDGGLDLGYVLMGAPAGLLIPAPCPAGPADELWRHTCCEAFVGVPGEAAYLEFNFSPSGQWAVYAFGDYRRRIEAYVPAATPVIDVRNLPDRLELDAHLPPALLPPAPLQLGLTAVVEGTDGSLAYWALAHPADRPDFHLRDGFVLTLTAAAEQLK